MHRTNPFAYSKPITLDSLDDLFAHHRTLTGGWGMTQTPPEPTPPAPTPPAPTPPAPEPPPAYTAPATQAELDRIIGERVQRERQKYADYDELKKVKEERDAAAEAAKDENQKAIDAARKEGESTATQAANARIVAAEARALAASWSRETDGVEAKFNVGPASLVRLLDLSGVKVGDDGEVDTAAIKTKLDELATQEPGLVGAAVATKPGPKPDPTQGGGGGGGDEKPGSIAEARRRAREKREAKTTKTA